MGCLGVEVTKLNVGVTGKPGEVVITGGSIVLIPELVKL